MGAISALGSFFEQGVKGMLPQQAAMPTSTAPAAPNPTMAYNEGPAAFSPLPTATAPSPGPAMGAPAMSMPNTSSSYGSVDV